VISVLAAFWGRATYPKISSFPGLANGDLVFQTDRSRQMLAILFATGSVYTHVGVVTVGPDGAPYVIEAMRTVRRVSLPEFVKQGYGGRLRIMRLQGLSAAEGAKVAAAAARYEGRPYDVYFTFRKNRIYCSELVYDAFQDGIGLSLGRVQRVADLNLHNFAVRRVIAARWRQDPLCEGVGSFDLCYEKIQRQEIITPVSEERDAKLVTVYDNYRF
jgi:hypothetical protein